MWVLELGIGLWSCKNEFMGCCCDVWRETIGGEDGSVSGVRVRVDEG